MLSCETKWFWHYQTAVSCLFSACWVREPPRGRCGVVRVSLLRPGLAGLPPQNPVCPFSGLPAFPHVAESLHSAFTAFSVEGVPSGKWHVPTVILLNSEPHLWLIQVHSAKLQNTGVIVQYFTQPKRCWWLQHGLIVLTSRILKLQATVRTVFHLIDPEHTCMHMYKNEWSVS